MSGSGFVTHTGSCHCGDVRFEVDAPAEIEALDCNCSICSKTGFLHLIVPKARFRLLTDPGRLSLYTFNTLVAKHYFCRRCGIKAYYIPRSNPDGVDVNVRCLDAATITKLSVAPFDGRNWEASGAALAHLSSG